MEDDLLEESWLFGDGALDAVGSLGGHDDDALSDDRLLSLLPPMPSDALYGGLGDAGPAAAPAPGSAAGRQGGEGRTAVDDTSRAALLRQLDDGGGWRCLNRSHPEDCSRCAARRRARVEQRAVPQQSRFLSARACSCLPAPGPATAADWVLVGDKSVKSGASHRMRRAAPHAGTMARAAVARFAPRL